MMYAYDLLASGQMTDDFLLPLQNVATAFVLAVCAGFLIGVVLHRLPRLRKAILLVVDRRLHQRV